MNSGLYAKESNKFMIQGKVTQYSYKHYTLYNQRKCTQYCLISYYYVGHTTALNYKPNLNLNSSHLIGNLHLT